MSHRLEGGYLLPGQTSFLYSAKETLAMAMRPRTLLLLGLDQKLSGMTVKKKYSLSVKNVNSYQNGFELLISDLTRWKKKIPCGIAGGFADAREPSGGRSAGVRFERILSG